MQKNWLIGSQYEYTSTLFRKAPSLTSTRRLTCLQLEAHGEPDTWMVCLAPVQFPSSSSCFAHFYLITKSEKLMGITQWDSNAAWACLKYVCYYVVVPQDRFPPASCGDWRWATGCLRLVIFKQPNQSLAAFDNLALVYFLHLHLAISDPFLSSYSTWPLKLWLNSLFPLDVQYAENNKAYYDALRARSPSIALMITKSSIAKNTNQSVLRFDVKKTFWNLKNSF